MYPPISVVITSKNRKDELKNALDSVLKQTIQPEILVLDDGSTDGTADMVSRDYPSVRCLRQEKSLGIVNARNKAISSALGRIVLVIDDDCVLISDETIAQTLKDFDHPRIGAVAIPHVYVRSDDIVRCKAPNGRDRFLISTFAAGASAIRRDVFVELGGYNTKLWQQFEEADFCLRMIDAGYIVRCGNSEPIHHIESSIRNEGAIWHHQLRSGLVFIWCNIPLPWCPFYAVLSIVQKLIAATRAGFFRPAWNGMFAGLQTICRNLYLRRPVTRRAFRIFQNLRAKGPIHLERIERELPVRNTGLWRAGPAPVCDGSKSTQGSLT